MLDVTRYSIKEECLKPWVKFIWHLEARDANIHHKLLPTDCIDVVLNASEKIAYKFDSLCVFAPPFHINGLRGRHNYIIQAGNVRTFGISFYPFGLFAFVNQSLAGIHDKVVDLFDVSAPLAQDLHRAISSDVTAQNTVVNIEKALCLALQVAEGYANKAKLILDFLELDHDITIQAFCAARGIHTKTFARNVESYTGYTPKILRSIGRFQKAGNQLIRQNPNQLLQIAYDNGFADQAHFIREFHRFSGASPRAFLQEKITVKENVKYAYR